MFPKRRNKLAQAFLVLECTLFEKSFISELDDHNEYFIIGDEFYGEVSTKKNGRTDMEDRVNLFEIYEVQRLSKL